MTIISHLNTLESSGLVQVAQIEPELEYLFRHALMQEAAYNSLLTADRKRLHLAVGETIEHLYPDRLDERAAMLARHFERAGDDERALKYYIKAGENALASFANQEAESYYRWALELSCPDCERVVLLSGLGEALYRLGRSDEAIQTWDDAIHLYKALDDRDGMAYLYARSARVAWYAGDQPEGLRLTEEGLAAVAGSPDSSEIAMLIHEAARACYFNGLKDKAMVLGKKALAMSEHLGAVEVQADTLATLGVLPEQPLDEALEALEKAVELSEAAGLWRIAGRAHHNLASISNNQIGGQQKAWEHYIKAVEIGRKRGVASEEQISLIAAVGMAMGMGRLDQAEEMLSEMETLVERMADPEAARFSMLGIRAGLLWIKGEWEETGHLYQLCREDARQRGDLQTLLGLNNDFVWGMVELDIWEGVDDWTEAESAAQEAIEISDRGVGGRVWPYALRVMLMVRQGRFEEAHQDLERAKALAEEQPTIWNEMIISSTEAHLAAGEGNWGKALRAAESAAGIQAKMGAVWGRARALQDWAEIHLLRGELSDLERARALLGEAGAIFEEMDARRHLAVVEDRLSNIRTQIHHLAVVSEADAKELARAAQVQESFLPERTPSIPGWQLVVTLKPARQTSGDFYDFIPLPNERWGILVADVADKGAGAALFMASSHSLIRTYASDYAMWPELVLSETNRRLLVDTHAGLFVTVFYGVLDPASGQFSYCNAGHNPPFLLNACDQEEPQAFTRTGPPLGIFEESTWEKKTVSLDKGDLLLLYTDGVTEAQNQQGEFYGDGRLVEVLQRGRGQSASAVRDLILEELRGHVGEAPQFDDITLMVLVRDSES
jgi:serine phosphatase RsbU (regulator of sigma subunit)/Flp pilus assembly protein TadD